jgi:TonB-dependent starch-binding outer membrane protein SusC
MTPKRFIKAILLPVVLLFAFQVSFAQNKTVTGKVTDSRDGSPVSGASVSAKGINLGTSTGADGSFRLSVPSSTTALIISSVGFGTKEALISDNMTISLVGSTGSSLNEVVVTGYGTARKKDLTGAVTSVKAKDFNQGVFAAPDQLIQGKVAGVQVVSNSGAPGGAATIRIRGVGSIRAGNSPLIVVDGVPLSGGSAVPGGGSALGETPAENPLNFINPSDIASMDVLKDASATAIFGSRGANGVIMITTKKGSAGAPKIDFNTAVGFSNILRKIDVLDGNEYRAALKQYNITSGGDSGGNVDALDAILRTGLQQNYNLAISGGNENGRYRLSAGYLDQQGIVKESGFKKYSANLSTSFKFLESKKLGLDINLITAHTITDVAPISNNAGFQGSLIGNALQWNPTIPLYKAGGDSINRLGGSTINPLDLISAYDNHINLTTILASISPSYKILNNLEYRMLYSINYGIGERKTEIRSFLNVDGILDRGYAQIANNKQNNQQITHTLTYSPKIGRDLNLNAVVGYEYLNFDYSGHGMTANQFVDYPGLKYTDYMQNAPAAQRSIYSFANPISELQSYFARATVNWADRLLVTATFRADGSSKFGKNNKYGYFPSIAAAWNISNEEFMGGANFVSNLKLRASWGQTGNQEFPSASSIPVVGIGTGANQSRVNFENPDIKWETNTMTNVGVDFGFIDNRITGTFDWFSRETVDPIFQFDITAPGPSVGRYWRNLPATISNSGFEIALMGAIIRNTDMQWNVGFNLALLKNEVKDLVGNYETGALHGQGITGATVQRLSSGHPLNVYYTRKFEGLDKATGLGIYTDNEANFYQGSPNPRQVYGITSDFTWKKLFAVINMNGAAGHFLYNNTFNSVIPIGNLGTRNIASSLIGGAIQENTSNAIKASSRYMEKGDYMKLANATIGYRLGSMGKAFSNVTATITGQNLFIISSFKGFDPEVNVDKNVQGVPSFGIEYSPYPSARTILFGLNFTL